MQGKIIKLKHKIVESVNLLKDVFKEDKTSKFYKDKIKETKIKYKKSGFWHSLSFINNRNLELKTQYNKEIKLIKKEFKEYKNSFEYHKSKNLKLRILKDFLRALNSSIFAFLVLGLLTWIIIYIFMTGSGKLTLDKILGNYKTETYTLRSKDNIDLNLTYDDLDLNNPNVSKRRGVEFTLLKVDDKEYVAINKVSEESPFNYLINSVNNKIYTSGFNNLYISSISLVDENNFMIIVPGENDIKTFINEIDQGIKIVDSTFLGEGGGFRGSLLNTLSLIGLSLVFAFPLGVGAAIYLGVYAKKTKFTEIIRSLIDMISGIPSIIFGLAGALIFIPIASLIPGTNGGNLISGALTMCMILLPTIVKTVEESIKVIPNSLKEASLALGASKSETVFKIVIPNAFPGMLTSLLLSIGRIIGESAALVFAMGTTIAEYANLNGSNATLAVHIWVILGGDHPSYDNACAIAIVIIIIVLILTILIKLISFKMNKFKSR